jgi:hypothetical protein
MTVQVEDAHAHVQRLVSVVKMAIVLECTIQERCSFVRFLWAEGPNAKDILEEIFPVYGGRCLSCKAVHGGVEKFSQARSKVADDARPCLPVEIAREATVQRLEELIPTDRRMTVDSVATTLGCFHGLAYSIMHDRLKFRKVCARWVPRELKDGEKMNRMSLSFFIIFFLLLVGWD